MFGQKACEERDILVTTDLEHVLLHSFELI